MLGRTLLWSVLMVSPGTGLDSVTQVFSVISSCIVDVSVGRSALHFQHACPHHGRAGC